MNKELLKEVLSIPSYSGRELKLDGIGFSDDDFLAKYMAKEHGIEYVHPAKKLIDKVGEEPILSMYAFHTAREVLNSKYFPCNYGSQSQDFALHYKLLTTYRNLIVDKISEYDDDGEIINSLRTEVRDEQLTNLLK